jgi:hypothetical protein
MYTQDSLYQGQLMRISYDQFTGVSSAVSSATYTTPPSITLVSLGFSTI